MIVVATDVDHIDGNTGNNHPDNLNSLCHSCHSKKTAAHDGSFGREGGANPYSAVSGDRLGNSFFTSTKPRMRGYSIT
jgi:hypothetical protein